MVVVFPIEWTSNEYHILNTWLKTLSHGTVDDQSIVYIPPRVEPGEGGYSLEATQENIDQLLLKLLRLLNDPGARFSYMIEEKADTGGKKTIVVINIEK